MAIGYACIVLDVPGLNLKTCTLKYATDEKLRHVTLHNLWVLSDVIDYNDKNGIRLFRISSNIIPFGSHPVNKLEWWNDYRELLSGIGSKIRNSGIRVSMHPGQYTILNSPDPAVVERSIEDLRYHTRFLDSLGVDRSHKIILHIGGVYGNKELSANRFIESCRRLPDAIKNRLVLENDEKSYNIADILTIAENVGLPVVFDNLHHSFNPPSAGSFLSTVSRSTSTKMPDSSSSANTSLFADASLFWWIERCRNTWRPVDGRQKIHYSQQLPGGKPGAHSLTIDMNEFMDFYSSLLYQDIDIMLEVKDKNLSALKCVHFTNH